MAYDPINKISSGAVLLPINNIDTDQIIPARFLKATSRKADFGKKLFADWRYDKEGAPVEDFTLNKHKGDAKILLAGDNFGCGSSREHAAWALYDYGFRVVLARSFADIFKSNAQNNGILVIELPENIHTKLIEDLAKATETEIYIDLQEQKLLLPDSDLEYQFEINPFRKQCLMEGTDLLDFLVARKNQIEQFEQKNL